MEAIGKKINYIKFHNFLERIEVKRVYSSLHTFYNTLIDEINTDGFIEWSGQIFTKEELMQTLKEEEGKLTHIDFGEYPGKHLQLTLKFQSGNELVVKLSNQEQYLQILNFLYDYKEEENRK
jgi:hypothetical protein